MEIVVSAMGSRGDVHPMFALSKRLITEGHTVTLAAPPTFAERAVREGVPFVGVGRDIQAWLNVQMKKGLSAIRTFKAFSEIWREDLKVAVEILAGLITRNTDLVISAGAEVASPQVAAARGVHATYVFYAPLLFPSADYPPVFLPFVGLPRWANQGLWRASDMILNRLWMPMINEHRIRLGLAPSQHILDVLCPSGLFAFDPRLFGDPSDIEDVLADNPRIERPRRVGALMLDNDVEDMDPALTAFLDAGAPPIYVGFGSMADVTPRKTLAMLEGIAQRRGWRFVLAQGWSAEKVKSDDERIVVIAGAPHERLFPRCAAVVHHGGAGTTHSALFARRPMVVVAYGVDQNFWGRRVYELGIAGPPLKKTKLRERDLERSISMALECTDNAEALGGRPASPGVDLAVAALTGA